MNAHIDAIRKQINDRAQEFCLDNPRLLGLHLQIETAMLIGASVVLGMPIDTDTAELPITPEAEEMLRELFEGEQRDVTPDVLSDEEQRKFAEEAALHTNETPTGTGKTYIEGRCPCGEDH